MSAEDVIVVLEEILDTLTDPATGCVGLDPQPCRYGIYPGEEVAWDACGSDCNSGDGQLWANLSTMDTRQDPPCMYTTFMAEVGVLRCAAPMKSDGSPPDIEDVRANADQQALDADTIRRAITCCESRSEALRGIVMVSWRALGPDGGCVGGVWVIRGVIDTCC